MDRRPHRADPAAASSWRAEHLHAWRGAPDLVADLGDDHEMTEQFGNSLARAGDRVIGFVTGAAILAFAWLIWTMA
ncbi:MAG: hypothetical protein ABSD74_02205 [Rhizomicrobium sp.]|jgi:hypothetical protein